MNYLSNTNSALQLSVNSKLFKPKKDKTNKNISKTSINEEVSQLAFWEQIVNNLSTTHIIKPEEVIQDLHTCEHCNSLLASNEENFMTCTNSRCGVIVHKSLDTSPEWKMYNKDTCNSDPTRCAYVSEHFNSSDLSFASKIVCQPGCSKGNIRQLVKYAQWNNGSYRDKTMYENISRMNYFASLAYLPKKIIDDAIDSLNKIVNAKNKTAYRGLNKDALLTGCLTLACNSNNIIVTNLDLALKFNVDLDIITKGIKIVIDIIVSNNLDIKINLNENAINFVDVFCNKLEMNESEKKLCIFVTNMLINKQKAFITKYTPNSLAAGVIYHFVLKYNLKPTISHIANVCNLTEVTIDKCNKNLAKLIEMYTPTIFRNLTSLKDLNN